jgi:hypothetical protein
MSEAKSTFAKREDETKRRSEEQIPDLAAKNQEQVKGGFVMRNNSASPT